MTLDPRHAKVYHQRLPARIRRYLNARGIPDPIIEKYLLGWNGRRITIPVYDREGRLVLYKLGKAPDDHSDSPKMLYDPPGVTAELYGWDTLRWQPSFVIVCEGEYDRLVLEARNFPAVTGTGGAGVFKEDWARAIAKVPDVYVCYDNDAPGRAGAERVARLIQPAKMVTLPSEVGEGGDVTDFFVRLGRTPDDFRRLLSEARPAIALSNSPTVRRRTAHHSSGGLDIQTLKARVPIEDIVTQYLPLHRVGRALMGRCCFHDDHEPSLAVFPDTRSFYCFGCQTHGDALDFLMEAEQITFREAVRVLQRLSGQP